MWLDDFGFTITQSSPEQGVYWIQVYEKNPGAAGANNLTAEKIQSFLYNWNCSNLTFSTNTCDFRFALYQAIQSFGFWRLGKGIVENADWELISYSASTGIGEIEMTIGDAPNIDTQIIVPIIELRGGTIVEAEHPVYRFRMERSTIRERFVEDIKKVAQKLYRRRRYCVSQNTLDWLAENNGATVTLAQLQNKLIDKMA